MLMGVGRFLHCACILKPGVLIHVYGEVCVYLLVHNPYVHDVMCEEVCVPPGVQAVYAHGYEEVCVPPAVDMVCPWV